MRAVLGRVAYNETDALMGSRVFERQRNVAASRSSRTLASRVRFSAVSNIKKRRSHQKASLWAASDPLNSVRALNMRSSDQEALGWLVFLPPNGIGTAHGFLGRLLFLSVRSLPSFGRRARTAGCALVEGKN